MTVGLPAGMVAVVAATMAEEMEVVGMVARLQAEAAAPLPPDRLAVVSVAWTIFLVNLFRRTNGM